VFAFTSNTGLADIFDTRHSITFDVYP